VNKTLAGFRDFLLRGNLIELAVAVIIGTAFGAVVTSFTKILTDLLGLIFNIPDFSSEAIGGVNVGGFINAVLGFVLTAAVLYFGVVTPYNQVSERLKALQEQPEAAPAVTSEDLLTEIRDLLRQQAAGNPAPGQVPGQVTGGYPGEVTDR
jgi:large conductance mechanosensitive channel